MKSKNYIWSSKPEVPNIFGTGDWFRVRQFFHWTGGRGMGWGMVQAVMGTMGSDASHLRQCGPVPNRGLGTPALDTTNLYHLIAR